MTIDNMFCKSQLDKTQTMNEQHNVDHDRDWIIGCIQHDGFIHTDRGDKANKIIIDALSAEASQNLAEPNKELKGSDLISRADAIDAVWKIVPVETEIDSTLLDKAEVIVELSVLPSAEPKTGWIPCSKMLPKAEDMYQPPEQRYLCQLEAYGGRKFCVLSRLKGAVSPFWDWYGVAVHDHEVIAWMPLPEPYKGGDDE